MDTFTSKKSLPFLVSDIQRCFQENKSLSHIMGDVGILLNRFGEEGIKNVINEILNNEKLIEDIASKSYLQGNGFYKILLSKKKDFAVRFHIWMPGNDAQENLHDHRWHFASANIRGSLKSEVWEESASSTDSEYDEYLYIDKETDPVLVGKVKVKFIKNVVHSEGTYYTLSPNELHRIVSDGNKIMATLVCHSASTKASARIIPIIHSSIPDVKPINMSPDEFCQLLRWYLKLSKIS